MRWSIFFLIAGFLAFSIYVGWKQGAFDFKREQMAVVETAAQESIKKASKKETSQQQKIADLLQKVKEPLKSEMQDRINEQKLDEAVALLEAEMGKQEISVSYGVVLKLAEKQTAKSHEKYKKSQKE